MAAKPCRRLPLAVLPMVLVAAVLAAAAPSPAPQSSSKSGKQQTDYALIYGTVWNAENLPVAGVAVTIRPADSKKTKWELVSDRRGEFAQRVPPGKQDYIVQANIKLPKGQPKPEVTVHIDDNEREDISLHLPAATGKQ